MPLLEHDRQSSKAKDQAYNTQPVGLAKIDPIRTFVRQSEQQEQEEYPADRNIDEEGIVPAQIFRQPATEQGAKNGSQDYGHSEKGHPDGLLGWRESLCDNRHGGGYQQPSHKALPGSSDDHRHKVGGDAA